jgi:hypothetical protein
MLGPRPQKKRVTLGGDKAYDTKDFVADLRACQVTPHVAQNNKRRRFSRAEFPCHAWGLRLRGVLPALALALPSVWPSALLNSVGTPVAIISQLYTQPANAPVNASLPASRLATNDSGSGWFATPFLCDSFIHYSTPVTFSLKTVPE